MEVGCCGWDDGVCWSSVGQSNCCYDTDNGAVDMYSNSCSDFYSDMTCVYGEERADDDFDARINCCSCGGGTTY